MVKYLSWVAVFGWAALIFKLTTYPQLVVSQDSFLQMIMMTSAHFIFFGIQAVFLCGALQTIRVNWSLNILTISVLTTSIYGLVIELIQKNVPGRSADPVDWVLDTVGAIICVYISKKYFRKNMKEHI